MVAKEELHLIFPLVMVGVASLIALGLILLSGSELVQDAQNLGGFGYAMGDVVPDGYGPPWNVFSSEQFFDVALGSYAGGQVPLTLSVSGPGMLVYRTYYVSQNIPGKPWKQYNFSNTTISGTNWISENASATVIVDTASIDSESYVVVYACANVGGRWKCGCHSSSDTACRKWSLQKYWNPAVPMQQCTGVIPGNSTICPDDDQDLTVNVSRLLVSACTDARKCEYSCSPTYIYSGGKCVRDQTCFNDGYCTVAGQKGCTGSYIWECKQNDADSCLENVTTDCAPAVCSDGVCALGPGQSCELLFNGPSNGQCSGVTQNAMTITWTPSSTHYDPETDRQLLRVSADLSQVQSGCPTPGACIVNENSLGMVVSSWPLSSLTPNTMYYARAVAFCTNANGTKGWKNVSWSCGTSAAACSPAQPAVCNGKTPNMLFCDASLPLKKLSCYNTSVGCLALNDTFTCPANTHCRQSTGSAACLACNASVPVASSIPCGQQATGWLCSNPTTSYTVQGMFCASGSCVNNGGIWSCASCTNAWQCNDNNVCTDDYCTSGQCTHTNNNAACPGGTCSNGQCSVQCLAPKCLKSGQCMNEGTVDGNTMCVEGTFFNCDSTNNNERVCWVHNNNKMNDPAFTQDCYKDATQYYLGPKATPPAEICGDGINNDCNAETSDTCSVDPDVNQVACTGTYGSGAWFSTTLSWGSAASSGMQCCGDDAGENFNMAGVVLGTSKGQWTPPFINGDNKACCDSPDVCINNYGECRDFGSFIHGIYSDLICGKLNDKNVWYRCTSVEANYVIGIYITPENLINYKCCNDVSGYKWKSVVSIDSLCPPS